MITLLIALERKLNILVQMMKILMSFAVCTKIMADTITLGS
jgi:hypothetical protein